MLLPQVLRQTLNCTLPIEIVYNGPVEADEVVRRQFEVSALPYALSQWR